MIRKLFLALLWIFAGFLITPGAILVWGAFQIFDRLALDLLAFAGCWYFMWELLNIDEPAKDKRNESYIQSRSLRKVYFGLERALFPPAHSS